MIIFNKAKEISYLSDYKRVHIGCIAVYKNHILAVGYNTNKTHPLQQKYNKYRKMKYEGTEPAASLHAEMSCLMQIKDMDIDFNKVELYVYRENKNGIIAISRPCAACMKMIDKLGIKKIHYTTDGGFADEIRKEVS